MTRYVSSAQEAVQSINSHDNIWIHSMAATPALLVNALAEHVLSLDNVTALQMHLENAEALSSLDLVDHLRNRAFFAGHSTRMLINQGLADYVPIFLSEIPKLFRSGAQTLNAAIIQVSPPDKHGNCSLGISVEATRAACECADTVIAHINPNMPRTHGDSVIPLSAIDIAFEQAHSICCLPLPQPQSVHKKIGEHVASLINDGDCLQLGIGAIPDAVLGKLKNHHNLGVHTEMFSDGVVDLVNSGVINNSQKIIHPGKIVTGFVMGTQRLYDFVDDNSLVNFLDIEYVNNIATIRKNPNMVSINSALQIDLTGQVCADSIGHNIYSGVGGQLDFVLGAQLSAGGRSIIALPSTAQKGNTSRFVPQLTPGSGVVTTRAHVDYVVSDIIISCVGNDDDVREIYFGEKAILNNAKSGAIIIDHTTTSARLAREIGSAVNDKSFSFLDAPVSGGEAGAQNGCLAAMIGGDQETLESVRSVLSVYCKAITYMGDTGSGQLCKMVNQLCVAGVLQGLSEGLTLAQKSGLDISTVVKAISGGAAGSWQMDNRALTMADKKFDFGFAIDWMRKDLAFCFEEAQQLGIELPCAQRADEQYAQLQAEGEGRSDTSVLIKQYR